MQTEYAEIRVKEIVKEREETITYYILEDEHYGIEISRSDNLENDGLILHNIVKSRKDAEFILEQLIKNSNDIQQASYIIEDILKNLHSKDDSEDKTLIS